MVATDQIQVYDRTRGYAHTERLAMNSESTPAVTLTLETGETFEGVPVLNQDLTLGDFLDQALGALEVS